MRKLAFLSILLFTGCAASPPPEDGPSPEGPGSTPTTAAPRNETGWSPEMGGMPPWWSGFEQDPVNQTVTLALAALPQPDGSVRLEASATNTGNETVYLFAKECEPPGIIFAWVTPAGEDMYDHMGLHCPRAGETTATMDPEPPTERFRPEVTPLGPGEVTRATTLFEGTIQYRSNSERTQAEPGNHTMTAHVCWSSNPEGYDEASDSDGAGAPSHSSGCAARFVTFTWDQAR